MTKYIVNIDMKYSKDIVVSAKNKKEAKQKAFDKFSKKLPKKLFDIQITDQE